MVRIADGYSAAPPQAFKALRAKLEWSQARLARELRTTPTTVSLWETGKSPIHPMVLIALAAVAGEDYREVMEEAERGDFG